MLKERGLAIASKDVAEIKRLENKIDLRQEYEKDICGVFITFETQEHVLNALQVTKKDKSCNI